MPAHKLVAFVLGVVILAGLAGCATDAVLVPGDSGAQPAGPIQAAAGDVAMTSTPVEPPFAADSAESAQLARDDRARRLGLPLESVTVAAVIGQEFSSEAFYCQTSKERIGKQDSPTVMTGFVILLNVSGRRYEYHASGSTVLFCRPLP